ncbi:Aste57867_11465 [Aphanomyces stellatus]|uniref:Aste57867_11465 protein n=1 Tax=Aphanomyces stellatus TaxID=120398 RepID=A0A485KTM8_9STRA|nr:hypothetical protein As57867_011422 [Aphanomyces stellatus]VFT88326.1 Aste57867_11465 [Aphanomyces stellatus]
MTSSMSDVDEDIIERLLFGDESIMEDVFDPEADTALDDLLALGGDTDRGDSSPPSHTDETKPKRKRTTQKQEITFLKTKQRDLATQLDDLKRKLTTSSTVSPWEGRAKDQMQAAQRAMMDNTALRTLLQDQLKTMQALERLLKKKPRLELSPNVGADEWRQWRLETDVDHRLQAMKAITDHMVDRLDSEFIQHGVFDLHAGQSGLSLTTRHNVLWFDFFQSMVLDVPYEAAADVFWAVSSFQGPYEAATSVLQTRGDLLLEVHSGSGDRMAYLRTHSTAFLEDGRVLFRSEGRWVVRRIVQATRTVIVYRSILDDALVPHDTNQWRDNLEGWITLERCPTDATKTIHRYIHESTGAMPPTDPAVTGALTTCPMDMCQGAEFLLLMLRSRMDEVKKCVTSSATERDHDTNANVCLQQS